jgi:hypothetical protein
MGRKKYSIEYKMAYIMLRLICIHGAIDAYRFVCIPMPLMPVILYKYKVNVQD